MRLITTDTLFGSSVTFVIKNHNPPHTPSPLTEERGNGI